MTINDSNFFATESAVFDERIRKYLSKFENGGLDRLIEKWGKYYFERQQAIQDEGEFRNFLRAQITESITYLLRRRDDKPNDWDEVNRIHWIKETYKELLHDEGGSSPKQEMIIEKVGARARILRLFGMEKK